MSNYFAAVRLAAAALPVLLGQGLIYLYVVRGASLELVAVSVVGLAVLAAVLAAALDVLREPRFARR